LSVDLQQEPLRLHPFPQGVNNPPSFVFKLLPQDLLLVPVVIGAERLDNHLPKRLHQTIHGLLEVLPPAFGQPHRFRLVRLFEVENVAPIRRGGLFLCHLFEKSPGYVSGSRVGPSGHIDIVFRVVHPDAEFDGLDGPILAHHRMEDRTELVR